MTVVLFYHSIAFEASKKKNQSWPQAKRLAHDVPMRPPGYFADCYRDAADAAFEERICGGSK